MEANIISMIIALIVMILYFVIPPTLIGTIITLIAIYERKKDTPK